jgi:4-phytase/acid phosphatase
VRAPLGSNAEIAQFAAQSWPTWGVPAGFLTAHGGDAAQLMGEYYGSFYRRMGLLSADCPVQNVYLYSDSDERTIVTGERLAQGINSSCAPALHHLPQGQRDSLIHTLGANPPFLKADPVKSLAALQGAVPNPAQLLVTQAPAFATLAAILSCPSSTAPSCVPVTSLPFQEVTESNTGLARLDGPVATGKTLAEIFVFEYADGMTAPGWGRATPQSIDSAMPLYVANYAAQVRPSYLAQAQASNFLSHISQTLAQFADGQQRLSAAYAPPASSRFVLIVAHDTNLSALAGVLNLHWNLGSDYQPDDTPPAGSLAFEIYQAPASQPTVSLFYQVQTLDQMRSLTPTSQVQPLRVSVPIPGCADPCSLAAFQMLVAQRVDPAFVIHD